MRARALSSRRRRLRRIALSSLGVFVALGMYAVWRIWGDVPEPPELPLRVGDDARDCPKVLPAEVSGQLAADDLDEVSGLVVSRTQPDVLWVHNDSGDRARVFGIGRDGRVRAEVFLDGVEAHDIEDIARGPGPRADTDYLYLADTGNNLQRRERVSIHRIEEPQIARDTAGTVLRRKAFTIDLTYEDGSHDTEAMFLDPVTGDGYLIAKRRLLSHQWHVGVYRLAASELAKGKAVARRVTTVPFGSTTAADILPDGSAIVVRNYKESLYYLRGPGDSIAQALSRPGCAIPLADTDSHGEAIGMMPDGRGYLTIAEGAHAPIYVYRFVVP